MKKNKGPLVLIASLTLAGLMLCGGGCSSKGKAGAQCVRQDDCAHRYYCLDKVCTAGPETACQYLRRCIPALSNDQAETLFGSDHQGFVQILKETPTDFVCEAKLRVIMAANRMVVLTRACGIRVTSAP